MSKKFENSSIEKKLANALANTARSVGKLSVNSACAYIFHQPKMPEGMKKLRKF